MMARPLPQWCKNVKIEPVSYTHLQSFDLLFRHIYRAENKVHLRGHFFHLPKFSATGDQPPLTVQQCDDYLAHAPYSRGVVLT